MAFCIKCGTELKEEAFFCAHCGNPVLQSVSSDQSVPICPKTYETAEENLQTEPRKAGRGFAISSMVLGAVGACYAFLALISCTPDSDATSMLMLIGTVSGLSVLALVFSIIARVRGWKNGFSKAGMITGLIGVALYLFVAITVSVHGFFEVNGNPMEYII